MNVALFVSSKLYSFEHLFYSEHIVPRLTLEELKNFDITNLERMYESPWSKKTG